MSETGKNFSSTPLTPPGSGTAKILGPIEGSVYKVGESMVQGNVTPNLEWRDISDEQYRVYVFADGEERIDEPVQLNVSASGDHQILDKYGESHYIPYKWRHLKWRPKPGFTNFALSL